MIGKMLDLAASAEESIADRLIENSLEDCVSAFDGFGRELCRVHAKQARNSQAAGRLRFQNLETAKAGLQEAFGVGLDAGISREEWCVDATAFQKRHLVAHKLGVIDQQYIDSTGDTMAVIGRKVRVSVDEVRNLSQLIARMASSLSDRLQKLGAGA